MANVFGIGGIKGTAITELTCEQALKLSCAMTAVLQRGRTEPIKILVGRDTRLSSEILECSVTAGICSAGGNAHLLGVVPNPAVPVLIRKYQADGGIIISSSSGAPEQNGIRFLGANGYPLPEETVQKITALLAEGSSSALKSGAEIGSIIREGNAVWDYVRYILKIVTGDLRGLRIAIDCANGSVSETAEKLFSGLGATCYMVNCAPDGTNAAPNILPLTGFVKEQLCQAGISFNIDGSGFVLIDEAGSVIDGDKILAILAEDAMNRQLLRNNSVVASEQCSMGFFRFCEEKGIKTIITPSDGVFDEMRRSDCNMGGNQLGKIYSFEENTLSDGQLSVIRFLELLQKSDTKLSAFVSRVESYPQIVVTVKIGMIHKGKWQDIPEVTEAVKSAREALGSDGRVLVAESASEPVVRISVEGKQFEKINELAMGLAECVKANCPK